MIHGPQNHQQQLREMVLVFILSLRMIHCLGLRVKPTWSQRTESLHQPRCGRRHWCLSCPPHPPPPWLTTYTTTTPPLGGCVQSVSFWSIHLHKHFRFSMEGYVKKSHVIQPWLQNTHWTKQLVTKMAAKLNSNPTLSHQSFKSQPMIFLKNVFVPLGARKRFTRQNIK